MCYLILPLSYTQRVTPTLHHRRLHGSSGPVVFLNTGTFTQLSHLFRNMCSIKSLTSVQQEEVWWSSERTGAVVLLFINQPVFITTSSVRSVLCWQRLSNRSLAAETRTSRPVMLSWHTVCVELRGIFKFGGSALPTWIFDTDVGTKIWEQ